MERTRIYVFYKAVCPYPSRQIPCLRNAVPHLHYSWHNRAAQSSQCGTNHGGEKDWSNLSNHHNISLGRHLVYILALFFFVINIKDSNVYYTNTLTSH